jgi:hypothetical protein
VIKPFGMALSFIVAAVWTALIFSYRRHFSVSSSHGNRKNRIETGPGEYGGCCKANRRGRLHFRTSKITISVNLNSDAEASHLRRNKSYSNGLLTFSTSITYLIQIADWDRWSLPWNKTSASHRDALCHITFNSCICWQQQQQNCSPHACLCFVLLRRLVSQLCVITSILALLLKEIVVCY